MGQVTVTAAAEVHTPYLTRLVKKKFGNFKNPEEVEYVDGVRGWVGGANAAC